MIYIVHLCKFFYSQDHIDPSPMDTMTTGWPLQQQLSSEKSLEEVETAGVVVGKAAGRMEVKVKVKQTETVVGPKVRPVCIILYTVPLYIYMHSAYYYVFCGNSCIAVGD